MTMDITCATLADQIHVITIYLNDSLMIVRETLFFLSPCFISFRTDREILPSIGRVSARINI